MKYEYRFKKIEMKGGISGLSSVKPSEEYHDIITQFAEEG